MNGIRESFLTLDLFLTYVQKYFLAPMDPPLHLTLMTLFPALNSDPKS